MLERKIKDVVDLEKGEERGKERNKFRRKVRRKIDEKKRAGDRKQDGDKGRR